MKDIALERNWPVVYAFFHPEGRSCGKAGLDGVFSGLLGTVGAFFPGAVTPDLEAVYANVPVTIVFEAFAMDHPKDYWRAEIALAEDPASGDKVMVSVTGAGGMRIRHAKLKLLGTMLTVVNGLAVYSLKSFQDNLKRTDVSLTFPSGTQVEGSLKFGE